ncbi:carph-isopro domain-containing protein [Roseixanthobacter glucoisosaccharinicivorans]|uniref:carph-isopro domain-containing protein n=1 Tax=Roseixanthobacter glucoisosaccharinicivorans TaxID=3119923 RepID=UPI00372D397A
MKSVAEILDGLGGVTSVSDGLGLPLGTVSAWKTRASIPSRHWDGLVRLARSRRLRGVTFRLLGRLHSGEESAA